MLPDSAAMTDHPAAPAPADHPPEPAAALTPPDPAAGHPTEEVAAPEAAASEVPAEEPDAAEAPANGTVAAEAPAAEGEEAPPAAAVEPDKKSWYVVKVQSGREESIKEAIERKVKIEGLEEFFDQIVIPTEKVTVLRNGKRVVRSQKMYPGYLIAHVEFNDRILYLFRETSGVGDFVTASVGRAPTPMPPREVERILASQAKLTGKAGEVPVEKVKLNFDKGDKVRVRDGTFAGMEGEVKEITEPKDPKEPVRVKVELTIFGRPVPVEVEAWQVDPV